MVGLWNRMDYGKTVNCVPEHSSNSELDKEGTKMTVTVTSPNGGPVNLRKAANKGAALVDRILPGTEAELLESGGEWSRIRVAGKTGWMMTEFLEADDSGLPDEDFGTGDLDDQDGSEKVALYFTVDELSAALPFLDKMVDQIAAKVGRG